MKNSILVVLFLGLTMSYYSCSDNDLMSPAIGQSDQASNPLDKKPAAHLIGDMSLDFMPGWDGTVDFEGGDTYGIRFFHLSDETHGQAYHFGERWEIYDPQNETIVLMAGPDEGVVPMSNFPDPTPYVMNGYVSEAYGEFAEWLGRNVHMSGVINWDPVTGDPVTAPGVYRVN